MASILDRVCDLDVKAQEIYGSYVTLEPEDQQTAQTQMQVYQEQVDDIQTEFVQSMNDNTQDLTDEDANRITQMLVDMNKRFAAFKNLVDNNPMNQSSSMHSSLANSRIPPKITLESAEQLNNNVKDLRQQLQEIHKAILEAETANEISQQEIQESRTIKDISTQAVNQIRQTTIKQNEFLQTELDSIRAQLNDTLAENNVLKHDIAEKNVQMQQLEQQCNLGLQSTNSLYEERARNQEDFRRLNEDLDRMRSKFNNIKNLYDFEVENFSQFREDAYSKISSLEAERDALKQVNEQMHQRLQEVEQCDTESAAIEIQKAATTIRQLTSTVNILKAKLQQSRLMKNDDQDRLKATIAVISDGKLDQALTTDAIEKSRLIQELNESRGELEQYKELISSVTKKDDLLISRK